MLYHLCFLYRCRRCRRCRRSCRPSDDSAANAFNLSTTNFIKYEGAELFAKRRRKADNWVVDESHSGTQYHPSGIPDFQQYQQRPVLSPNILPAYSDAGKHRVQLNIHQNQLIEKYSKPGLQVVQSPWKAALQTGSASSAFLEDTKSFSPPALTPIPSSKAGSKDWTDANEPMPHGSSRRNTNV